MIYTSWEIAVSVKTCHVLTYSWAIEVNRDVVLFMLGGKQKKHGGNWALCTTECEISGMTFCVGMNFHCVVFNFMCSNSLFLIVSAFYTSEKIKGSMVRANVD